MYNGFHKNMKQLKTENSCATKNSTLTSKNVLNKKFQTVKNISQYYC